MRNVQMVTIIVYVKIEVKDILRLTIMCGVQKEVATPTAEFQSKSA